MTYSVLTAGEACRDFVSTVIVLESSERGCPLAVIVKLLYHPKGLLLTSYPFWVSFSSKALRIDIAGSREAKFVDKWAYGYTITFLVFSHPNTSSIEEAAFVAICSGSCSSFFSTVEKTTSPFSRAPLLCDSSRGSGSLTAFSRASYSNRSA